jgi:hypothetical protein
LFGLPTFKGINPATDPLHYGEVMALWTFLAAVEEARAICLTMLNHTEDPDLKRLIERSIKDIKEPTGQQVRELLANEGVPMPQSPQNKAKADPTDVPPGARLLDEEISQIVLGKLEALLMIVSGGLVQSLREDIGALFFKFQVQFLGEGYALRSLMKQRGWLKVPPYHYGSKP